LQIEVAEDTGEHKIRVKFVLHSMWKVKWMAQYGNSVRASSVQLGLQMVLPSQHRATHHTITPGRGHKE
jgi:hypothetical protein